MTIEEKRRELFERIAAGSGWSIAPKQDRLRGIIEPRQYHSPATQMAWEGFSAALDAVVIELPEPEPFGVTAEESLEMDYEELEGLEARHGAQYSTYRKCRAAIESTGLGLKVLP